jgi:hypothetical protein
MSNFCSCACACAQRRPLDFTCLLTPPLRTFTSSNEMPLRGNTR